jgi:DNA repair protein RecO (recombination protein O)
MLVTTDAIILRSYNLAEADRIVVCLTRSAGLVRAVAKGARRMKSRFGAALEPFTLVRLAFYEKENRELVNLSSAEILKSNFDVAAQVEVAEVLGYMSELIGEFAPPHEANEKLFRMVQACVDALASAPESAKLILRYFEIWLLRLAGSFPDTSACAVCGRSSAAGQPLYVSVEGTARCASCSRGIGTPLAVSTQEFLRASQKLGPAQFATAHQSSFSQTEPEVAELTHRLIVRALDRRPRTMIAPGAAAGS